MQEGPWAKRHVAAPFDADRQTTVKENTGDPLEFARHVLAVLFGRAYRDEYISSTNVRFRSRAKFGVAKCFVPCESHASLVLIVRAARFACKRRRVVTTPRASVSKIRMNDASTKCMIFLILCGRGMCRGPSRWVSSRDVRPERPACPGEIQGRKSIDGAHAKRP